MVTLALAFRLMFSSSDTMAGDLALHNCRTPTGWALNVTYGMPGPSLWRAQCGTRDGRTCTGALARTHACAISIDNATQEDLDTADKVLKAMGCINGMCPRSKNNPKYRPYTNAVRP